MAHERIERVDQEELAVMRMNKGSSVCGRAGGRVELQRSTNDVAWVRRCTENSHEEQTSVMMWRAG